MLNPPRFKVAWAVTGVWVMAFFAVATLPLAAQWRSISLEGVPLGADGKPDLAAPAPRTAAGRVDLSGIYQSSYKYFQNIAADLGLDKVPMTDEGRARSTPRACLASLAGTSRTRTACRRACPRSTWRRCRSGSCRRTSSWSSSTRHSICGGRCTSMAASSATI